MILRSLLLLGVGAAIACAVPAFAAGTTAAGKTETATADSQKVAAVEAETPKVDKSVVKKPKAKATAKKSTRKKLAKTKKPAATEEAKAEKPKGLFAALFGGGIKEKKVDPKANARSKVVAKPVARTKKEQPKPEEIEPVQVSVAGNKGELRSVNQEKPGLFASLFGGALEPEMLAETRALDSVLEKKQSKAKFKVRPEFMPQEVEFSGYNPGTIVIDTGGKYLYLVENRWTARRYAIAVGREGLEFKGGAKVGDKQEWPRWIPTKEMQEREPKKYGQYKDGMDGGAENPLGARAIYLYQGKQDTHIRIHGTNQPQSIGSASSNGCFRMINDHVIDLYNRVKVGTPVVVL
jgi:lipoprotein-anchoring transpeptidase ErfK/SrfK